MSERCAQAVLFDMDGTLLDSEKVWDIALDDLAAHLGGTLSASTRAEMVGSNLALSVGMLHDDLGVAADHDTSARFLIARTSELFQTELRWKPGAQELLAAVVAAGYPTALVTSTERGLTEIALDTLGRDRFTVSVCGDEVEHNKPSPDAYLLAARQLGVSPRHCVAVEDSPRGIASAEAAGCVVIAVPSEVPVPEAPTRTVLASLEELDVAALDELACRRAGQPVAAS